MTLVQDLENSVDIVELVSKYVKLKKAGTNYKSNCPFPGHNEKTPSFVVSPVKQLAYCFGCHKGGGALKFIMDLENCDFKEALQTLGQITGKSIDTTYEGKNFQSHKDVYQIFKDITIFYEKSLEENADIKSYFSKRAITDEDIKKFHLGFSADGRALYRYLEQKGYSANLIEESKVFLDIRNAKDKFLGRIIFPLQNLRGDIVAFAGRIVNSGEPKYLNSPTTDIYDKSSILYGLYQGKKAISDKDFVIICEGYMDTIALHRAGYENTVCVSGTALTEKHIQILKRLTSKFYLCFDNDKAGENATKLSLELLKNKGIEVRIIHMSGGKDPDELIKEGISFESLIKSALSPVGFYLKNTSGNITSIDEKRKRLKEVLDVLKNYSDGIEVDDFLKEISGTLNISYKIVVDEFNLIKLRRERIIEEKEPISREDNIIAHILVSPDNKEIVTKNILFPDFISQELKRILESIENIESFSLERRDRLKGLALEKEERFQKMTIENQLQELVGLCKEVNSDIGIKKLKEINQLIENDPKNDTYQLQKIELARKLKQGGIK